MPALNSKAFTMLASVSCSMATSASTALYTVPIGRVLRISHIVVRNCGASLAGTSTYSVTGWRQAFALTALTTANTGYIVVRGADLAQYTEQTANTVINFSNNTTGAATTATVELFGLVLAD